MIAFPITLPSTPKPRAIRLMARSVVGVSESPFTLQQQVFEHQGDRWEAELQYPPMRRQDAEAWIGALLSLNGRRGTFRLGDPVGAIPRGVATGNPQVDGGGQTGRELATKGWTPDIGGILRAGDYIEVGGRLYKVVKDASSDSNGEALLDIWPRLRESPADDTLITITNTRGTFRLAGNETAWEIGEAKVYGISFMAVEAV